MPSNNSIKKKYELSKDNPSNHSQYSNYSKKADNDIDNTTIIIQGRKKIMQDAIKRYVNCTNDYACLTANELSKTYKPFLSAFQQRVSQRLGSTKILTNIEKEIIPVIKEFSDAGIEIRHVDVSNLRRCAVYDSDIVYFSIVEPLITQAAVESVEQTEGEDLWISSTEPSVIQSAKKRFEMDWDNAISAAERIKFIEQGTEVEFLKVLTNTTKVAQILIDLAKSIQEEALCLIPSSIAMEVLERLGIINSFVQASLKGAIIKIICPINNENSNIVARIIKQAPGITIMNAHEDAASTILVVDSKRFLQAEQKDPKSLEISKSIGFAIYSNSKRNVTSCKSFFKLLWDQYTVNESLRQHELLQQEFINVVAHELRTPLTPIIGLSEHLRTKIKDQEHIELLDIIINDAKKLHNLSENILDITRIEGKIFNLKKEHFNLNELILNTIRDYEKNMETKNKNIRFEFFNDSERDLIINADKNKIIQVFSNLIGNSINFISGQGVITINIAEKEFQSKKLVIITIKDNGEGINPNILPRLFTKFASKSFYETGLGLYICKAIVEAHGGMIWTENNNYDQKNKGATFSFSLPLKD